MPNYHNAFSLGESIKIASLDILRKFQQEWKFHHPLEDEQLPYADEICGVRSISYYHGGSCLYELDTYVKDEPPSEFWHKETVPGVWHERCLTDKDLTYFDQKNERTDTYSLPLASEVYIIEKEIRDGQPFVTVKSKQGLTFLAFRHINAEYEVQSMREVSMIRNAISFEGRYNFHGVGHDIVFKKVADTRK